MRILYLLFYHLNLKISKIFYKICLLFKFNILGVSYGSFETGGGLMKLYISRKGQLIIGENANFANKWEVGYPNKISITIGNNVHIGGSTKIYDTNFHNMNYNERRVAELNGETKTSPVIIEDDVFIGTGVLIGKGVTIGARSIIAAGSVVVKSVPADELWGGNPAKFIKKINI